MIYKYYSIHFYKRCLRIRFSKVKTFGIYLFNPRKIGMQLIAAKYFEE